MTDEIDMSVLPEQAQKVHAGAMAVYADNNRPWDLFEVGVTSFQVLGVCRALAVAMGALRSITHDGCDVYYWHQHNRFKPARWERSCMTLESAKSRLLSPWTGPRPWEPGPLVVGEVRVAPSNSNGTSGYAYRLRTNGQMERWCESRQQWICAASVKLYRPHPSTWPLWTGPEPWKDKEGSAEWANDQMDAGTLIDDRLGNCYRVDPEVARFQIWRDCWVDVPCLYNNRAPYTLHTGLPPDAKPEGEWELLVIDDDGRVVLPGGEGYRLYTSTLVVSNTKHFGGYLFESSMGQTVISSLALLYEDLTGNLWSKTTDGIELPAVAPVAVRWRRK